VASPLKGKESTAFEDQTEEPGRKQCFRRPNGRAGKRGMEIAELEKNILDETEFSTPIKKVIPIITYFFKYFLWLQP
jgi:hypothetical protein